MGTWNTSITGNDTPKMIYILKYTAAFYKFDVEEALKRIDNYIRSEMFDESDEEEWCNYIYSLADFMWKKGILTDSVRNKAIEMIDSGLVWRCGKKPVKRLWIPEKRSLPSSKKNYYHCSRQGRKLSRMYKRNGFLMTEISLPFNCKHPGSHIRNKKQNQFPKKIFMRLMGNMC